jgi:acyl-CoA thioester hydrolase
MSRIKIEIPEEFFFSCTIPVRITDINYGGHVGNDKILSVAHEARMQYLKSIGYSEMEFDGVGTIMADAAIEYKNEIFYGDNIKVSVRALNITKIGFDLIYKLEVETNDRKKIVALIKTGMICFDYEKKKITAMPEEAKKKLLH